jgi:hypothetical protein
MAPESPEHVAEHSSGRSPDAVDRIMVGACGAIWLVLLATSVFATVALVKLGSGRPGDGEGQSSWVLYSIIIVSALVILGAIPLLLRARRNTLAEPGRHESTAAETVTPVRPTEAPTEKMRVFGVDPYASRTVESTEQPKVSPVLAATVDRLWLRGTTALLSAMGVALIAVSIGTYLLAGGSDTAAWVGFGFAGVITVAMPAVLAFFQRQLGEAVEEAGL